MVTLKLSSAEAQALKLILDDAKDHVWSGLHEHDVADLADKLDRATLEESIERRRILREAQS